MAAKKSATKTASKKKVTAEHGPRADFGKPIEEWFEKQPEPQRTIATVLRTLIEEAVPDLTSAIEWGNPFFTVDGAMVCAISSHKAHVNLILSGGDDDFDDPKGLLGGASKLGRHLSLRTAEEVPRASVKRWVKTAARIAKERRAG